MVKTKNEVVLDSRTGKSSVIYFSITEMNFAFRNDRLDLMLTIFKKDSPQSEYEMIQMLNIPLTFSSFIATYGTYTLENISDSFNTIITNSIVENRSQYWGLTANDLEEVL